MRDIRKVRYKYLLIQLITMQIKHLVYITSTTMLLIYLPVVGKTEG